MGQGPARLTAEESKAFAELTKAIYAFRMNSHKERTSAQAKRRLFMRVKLAAKVLGETSSDAPGLPVNQQEDATSERMGGEKGERS